jgi:hypothetical protein
MKYDPITGKATITMDAEDLERIMQGKPSKEEESILRDKIAKITKAWRRNNA